MAELFFIGPAPLHKTFYRCMKFRVNSFYSLEVMAQTKNQTLQRAITQNVRVAKLWFLCIAPFHNEFYHCMKFQVYSLNSLEVMIRSKVQTEINKGQ